MENTSDLKPLPDRELFYYRARQKNRIFDQLVTYFAERAERDGLTKRDLARKLSKDPAQITRWLREPSNLTLDTISDLLLALDAEMDCRVTPFDNAVTANDVHPFVADYWEQGRPTKQKWTIEVGSSVQFSTPAGAAPASAISVLPVIA